MRRWLIAVPSTGLLLVVLALSYAIYIDKEPERPVAVLKEAAATVEQPEQPMREATAELTMDPQPTPEVAKVVDPTPEPTKQLEVLAAEEKQAVGGPALLRVSIGPREAPKTYWAVDIDHSTMAQVWREGDPLVAIKVGTGLDLMGVALAEPSEALLAGVYVYVHGDYAYVGGMSIGNETTTNVGVRILDISDPTNPELVGRIPLRSRQVNERHSHGDAIATHIETDAFQGDIAIVGHSVPDTYSVDEFPMHFGIWEVTAPGDPQLLSVLSLGHYSWMHETGDLGDKPEDAKAIDGNYFYVVYNGTEVTDFNDWFSYDFRLAVADLSDPSNPLVIADWDDPDEAWLYSVSLNQAGTRAYVAGIAGPPPAGSDEKRGLIDQFGFARIVLYVLDVRDPTSPTLIARHVCPYPKPNAHRPRAVSNDDECLLILADGRSGHGSGCPGWGRLHILDISELGSIQELSTFAIAESNNCHRGAGDLYYARDIAVKGDLVYSTWVKGGLHVVDISDPTNPVAVGEFRSPDKKGPWLSDVALYGDYALASTVWGSGLYIVKRQ